MKIAETFLCNTAFRGDAHALLICIYKDPNQPLAVRIDCAKAALPYEKPRLAAVEVKPIGTPGFALPAPIDPAVAQAIGDEYKSYFSGSVQQAGSLFEKLLAARSLDQAMVIQAEFVRLACTNMFESAQIMFKLYGDLARNVLIAWPQRVPGR